MRRLHAIQALTAATMALLPVSANARNVAGWEITYGDTSCELTAEYDVKGGTDVSLDLYLDGSATLLLGNKNWSITQGDSVDLAFFVNGQSYRGTAMGVSESYDPTKMVGAKFEPSFVADFAASPYLVVTKGSATVTRLSLSGSGAAIQAAKQCLETVRARVATANAKIKRESDIADDPFAKPGEPNPRGVAVKGGPRGNPLGWFTDDDYPADAKRAGAEGRVSVLLQIDTSGKVDGCRVTASSGNASLDDATCRLAQRRGRFTVQKDSGGNAQAYSYTLPGIRWTPKAE